MLPVGRDLRRILPAHRRGRIAAFFAILSLALGIAGNGIFFSWTDTFLFEPLPYAQPERVVLLGESREGRRTLAMVSMFTALPTWEDFRERSRTLEDWAALRYHLMSLSEGDRSVSVFVGQTTPGLFHTLGVEPVRGRAFTEDEGKEGAPGVALATWDFWTERGGADSGLLNSELVLDGLPYLVVGVLPEDFEVLVGNLDLWIPLQADPARWPRDARGVISLARMSPGVGMEAVRTEVADISRHLQSEYPEAMGGWEMRAYHMDTEIPDPQSPLHLAIIQGLVFLVLLIVCANVAMLLLARGEERRREMALRTALGAGRIRIVGQHLRESMAVAGVGGLLGILLTVVGIRAVAGIVDPTILPDMFTPEVDPRVMGFTAGVVLLSGLAFGLAPAIQSLRQDHAEVLKVGHGASAGGGRRSAWVSRALVAGEIALCLVALGGGSVLVQTFRSVHRADPGFEDENLLVVEFGLPHWKYEGPEEWLQVMERLEEGAAELPGVRSVGLVSQPPQALMVASDTFRVEGAPEVEERAQAQILRASPGHRPTLEMPLLAGRFFDERDRRSSPPVVVVSESLADRHFPRGNPVGRRLSLRGASREIVGVVGDVQQSLVPQAEGGLDGAIYIPLAQEPGTNAFLLARTGTDPLGLADPVRRAFWDVDPDVTVHAAETQAAYARRFTAPLDFVVPFVTIFGFFALLLASLGTYGVVTHAVARRSHELGVRLAVGARPSEVVRLIAGQGLLMATAGLAAGTLLLIPVLRVAGATLEGFAITSVEPVTVVAVGGVLLAVTLLAAVVPATRAGRVDPLTVLRVE